MFSVKRVTDIPKLKFAVHEDKNFYHTERSCLTVSKYSRVNVMTGL